VAAGASGERGLSFRAAIRRATANAGSLAAATSPEGTRPVRSTERGVARATSWPGHTLPAGTDVMHVIRRTIPWHIGPIGAKLLCEQSSALAERWTRWTPPFAGGRPTRRSSAWRGGGLGPPGGRPPSGFTRR